VEANHNLLKKQNKTKQNNQEEVGNLIALKAG
jgi:hypothetical protein